MKWFLIIAGIIILIIAAVYLIGLALPVKHTAMVQGNVPATQQQVWERITSPASFNTWRSDVKQVEMISETEWKEKGDNGNIPMKITEQAPPAKLVTVINSKDLPFGGEWVITLQSAGSGTNISITENGEVYNPVFRFMSRFVMGHDGTIKKYIADLKKSFQ